jgi:hypothetical protein
MTTTHSSTQAAHSSTQLNTSSTQHANPLAQQASSLRPTGLDSIPCVPVTRSERRHVSEGEPGFGGGRRAVCLALYLHVYTYVYHTCIFTCIHICISHTKDTHDTHTSRPAECRAAFSTRGGMYRHSQEDMHWLSLVWKGVLGAEEAGVGVKTVMAAARRQ